MITLVSSVPPIDLEAILSGWPAVAARFREVLGDLAEERAAFPRLFRLFHSPLHGLDHWARAGVLGLAIAGRLRALGRVTTPCLAAAGGLEEAAILAAFFHDSCRTVEWSDPGHAREGREVWRHWSSRKGLGKDLSSAVAQAILFHAGHRPPVDPEAMEAAVCLANADRLERIRFGESPRERLMYDDGAWREIEALAPLLVRILDGDAVRRDLGIDGVG